MGSLLDFIDLNQGGMARKFLSHKRHGGLDAPRNSMELPIETYQRFSNEGDNARCNYCMIDWPEKNCYGNEAPMKKLIISEEIARRPNTGHNAPSVVARLMGVDTLPLHTRRPLVKQVEKNNDMKDGNPTKEEWLRKVSIDHVTHSSRQRTSNPLNHDEACDLDRRDDSQKLNKYKPREHPQEEELQKFKKDFEAWQAARFKECSKFVEIGSSPSQYLEQQSLNKEKLALYANSVRTMVTEKPLDLTREHTVTVKSQETGLLEHQKKMNLFLTPAQNKTNCARKVSPDPNFQQHPLTSSSRGCDVSSAPTKIVILRPGLDKMGTNEESWASSPGFSEDRGSIEEFLEEVKERLNCELKGKSSKRSTVRGGGIETPYSEKTPDAKQIAQSIVKHARESVTSDFGTALPRSESTRSYRSDIQCDGTSSPEFMNRDTRRLLTERLKNVLKQETSHGTHRLARASSRSTVLDKEKCSVEEIRYTSNKGDKATNLDNMKDELDMHGRSFRQDPGNDVMQDQELSPRNLIRSLSAPVSATSFGKLLLEDRNMLTGAHIRRKHEAIEKVKPNVKKHQKEKFNLRRKVSSFSHSFILRGRIFGRKIQSWEEPHGQTYNLIKDYPSPPIGSPNFYERQENPTEVPPSPASVCSSTNEEYWRTTDYFSPSSTPDVHPLDDSEMPRVFREISSNLNELRRQLNRLDTYGSEETMIDEQPVEEEMMMEIEDQAESYIRDLLVASGLYDGSRDKYISRWDPLGKPVSNQVFEDVEESYTQETKDEEGYTKGQLQKINHKLMCDLLNEALPSVLGLPSTMSRFMRSAIGPMPRPPQGKKLLERVWEILGVYVYPPWDRTSQSLDNIVARDLESTPWAGLVDEDINALGKDLECQIISDLIQEIVKDMLS